MLIYLGTPTFIYIMYAGYDCIRTGVIVVNKYTNSD